MDQLLNLRGSASPSSPCYHLFSFPIKTSSTTLVLLLVSRFSIVVRFLSTIWLILQLYDLSLILETDSTSRKSATKAWLYNSLSFSSIDEALIQKNHSTFIKNLGFHAHKFDPHNQHIICYKSQLSMLLYIYMYINILLFFFLHSL